VNYRHAFHAGNFADVLKHAALWACLAHLRSKDAAFRVIDAHAGLGLYDLESDEAERSPEWRDGIGRLWQAEDTPGLIADWLAAVRSVNPDGLLRYYPGSPELIARALRPQDRALLCELHPKDGDAVAARYAHAKGVKVEMRDGWGAARAFLPPPERRGLLILDPPFERPDDHARLIEALDDALSRFATGMVLLWRPVKDARAEEAYRGAIAARGAKALDAMLQVGDRAGKGLAAAAITIINPAWTLEERLAQALPWLTDQLARDRWAQFHLIRLSGEW
jgi:23S rRNA (adenine2030-N6)-methyltransferase